MSTQVLERCDCDEPDGPCEDCDDPHGHTCMACEEKWCQLCWGELVHALMCPPGTRDECARWDRSEPVHVAPPSEEG